MGLEGGGVVPSELDEQALPDCVLQAPVPKEDGLVGDDGDDHVTGTLVVGTVMLDGEPVVSVGVPVVVGPVAVDVIPPIELDEGVVP